MLLPVVLFIFKESCADYGLFSDSGILIAVGGSLVSLFDRIYVFYP